MTVVIFADVHSNIHALEAVLQDAGNCDAYWCVGDVVGYGPRPNQCVARVMEVDVLAIAGNHDLGSLGEIDVQHFNPYARIACEWNGKRLDERSREYLESLPLYLEPEPGVTLVHGSPRDPVWEYILSTWEAVENFEVLKTPLCYIAHSHAPVVFCLDGEDCDLFVPEEGKKYHLEEGSKYIINVGSVGQPRDGDPRACYVVFDADDRRIRYHRVEYDVGRTQEEMRQAGLPTPLVNRLSVGR